MSEEKVPQAPSPEPPAWEIKGGRMYIDGVDVTDQVNPPPQEEPETPKAPPDPVVEGNVPESDKEEPEEPEAEPEPEPEPEKEEKVEPEADEEPEEESEPEEPDKIKLRLKYKGEEYEEENTPEQIAMKLQRLRFLDETQRETFERSKEIEPYWHLVKSDWFKERLKEARETGEFELPPAPPAPPDEVLFEIAKRESEPDYYEILYTLQQQAIQMPKKAQEIIDSNPNVFLKEFDRVAQEVRSKKEPPPQPKKEKEKPSPKEVEKKLELKESAKEKGRVTKPGTPPEPVSPQKKWADQEKRLIKQIRDPNNAHRQMELIADLLTHRDNQPI